MTPEQKYIVAGYLAGACGWSAGDIDKFFDEFEYVSIYARIPGYHDPPTFEETCEIARNLLCAEPYSDFELRLKQLECQGKVRCFTIHRDEYIFIRKEEK